MNVKEEIASTIEGLDLRITNIKNELKARLEALPDNSNIKRVSRSPSCFIVSSSQLTKYDNWTPFFHDHKAQYQFVIDVIERSQIETIIKKIESIIEKGSYRKPNQDTVKFHPEVIKQLKGILV